MHVRSSNGGTRVVAGSFTTDSTGAVSKHDISEVTSVVAGGTTGQYVITLSKTFKSFLAAFVTVGNTAQNGVYISNNVTDATTPTVTVGVKDYNLLTDYVITGGIAAAPTTASTQATGTGNTAWRINLSAVYGVVTGVEGTAAAAADTVIHSGSQLLTSGQSIIAAAILKAPAGIFAFDTVKGSAATTGSQTAPSDSDITTAVGSSRWIRLANCTLNRTGDITVTQSQDTTVRSVGTGGGVKPEAGTVYVALFLTE